MSWSDFLTQLHCASLTAYIIFLNLKLEYSHTLWSIFSSIFCANLIWILYNFESRKAIFSLFCFSSIFSETRVFEIYYFKNLQTFIWFLKMNNFSILWNFVMSIIQNYNNFTYGLRPYKLFISLNHLPPKISLGIKFLHFQKSKNFLHFWVNFVIFFSKWQFHLKWCSEDSKLFSWDSLAPEVDFFWFLSYIWQTKIFNFWKFFKTKSCL